MNNKNYTILFRGSLSYDRYPAVFVKQTIPSIRNWFDGQLVISTWKGQEQHLQGLEKMVDDIILNDDPGFGCIQSYDRQLISYNAGINKCVGDLILVIRADFLLERDPFFLWNRIPPTRGKNMKIFDNRIVIGNMMTISPDKVEKKISNFRPSDWIQIGKKIDLLKWSGILKKSHELYSMETNLVNLKTNEYKSEIYGSEQLWFISLLNQYVDKNITLSNYWLYDSYDAWCALVNNFAIFNTKSTMGAHNLNWQNQPEFHPWYITEEEYFSKNEQLNGTV